MTPLEAAVRLQAAMIRDGLPASVAAREAWRGVKSLWAARPEQVYVTGPEYAEWRRLADLPD